MIAGHFGLAAGSKAAEPAAPLWAAMLATLWLDVVFAPLWIAGIESLDPLPGTGGGYGQVIIRADYTHSLVGAVVLAAIFGAVAAIPWGRRVGVALGVVAFSHWVLDLVVHRADMAILPGNAGNLPLLGFGLWQSTIASALVELAIVLLGAYLYWRAADRVATTAGDPKALGRARLVSGLIVVAGVATLLADVYFG